MREKVILYFLDTPLWTKTRKIIVGSPITKCFWYGFDYRYLQIPNLFIYTQIQIKHLKLYNMIALFVNLWGQRSQKKLGRGQKNIMRIIARVTWRGWLLPPIIKEKLDRPKSISLSVLVQITKLYSKYFKSEQNSSKVINALRQNRIRILPLKKQKRILRFFSSFFLCCKQKIALSSGKAKTLRRWFRGRLVKQPSLIISSLKLGLVKNMSRVLDRR